MMDDGWNVLSGKKSLLHHLTSLHFLPATLEAEHQIEDSKCAKPNELIIFL